MKRPAAIEPGIGHLKREHRMDRSRLKGVEGDRINAIMSAAGMNFGGLLTFYAKFHFGFNFVKEQVFAKFPAKYNFFRID